MLNIQKLTHLAKWIDVPVQRLREVAERKNEFIEEWSVWDPVSPDKARNVLVVSGELRTILARLVRRVFAATFDPSPHSHGCVTGRSIATNAMPHCGNSFAFTTDLSSFYPSISNNRVHSLFLFELNCSPDVANTLTKLCTYNYHLALGLPTSPILADRILNKLDHRISGACQQAGMAYTRYVDDVTVSAKFPIDEKSFGPLLGRIISEHGFKTKKSKEHSGRLPEGLLVTQLVVKKDKLDVSREYYLELLRLIDDHISLGRGSDFRGPFLTKRQLIGKINFVRWINPGRDAVLRRRIGRVNWQQVWLQAERRGLIVAKKRMGRVGSPAPDFSKCFGSQTDSLLSAREQSTDRA